MRLPARIPIPALRPLMRKTAAQRRLVLVGMASVLLLSGCMLSPLFQAPAAIMTGFAVLLGLAACSGGSGGGGGDQPPAETPAPPVYVAPTVPGCASGLIVSSQTTWQPWVTLTPVANTPALGAAFHNSTAPTSHLGDALAAGCDINGDGKFDLAVGEPYKYSNNGRVTVLFGDTNFGTVFSATGTSGFNLAALSTVNGHVISGQYAGQAGTSLAMGDTNGDSIADLVIGAPNYAASGSFACGAAWVVFGGSTFDTTGALRLEGTFEGGLTTDGSRGFLIKTTESHSYTNASNGTVTASLTGGNRLGTSVAVAELGGDSLGDVIVGGPVNHGVYASCGADTAAAAMRPRAAVVFGNSAPVTSGAYDISGHTFLGQGFFAGPGSANITFDTHLGESVAVAGDLNGDGILDMIAGAPHTYLSSGAGYLDGAAHVLFGKSGNPSSATPEQPPPVEGGLTGTNGFSILGGGEVSYVGYHAAPAGDVNGDGILDVMVSGTKYHEYDPSFSPRAYGQVHVVFGKSSDTAGAARCMPAS